MAQKPKLSLYWAASCGGCEIAVVNLHERILDVDSAFDFFFCPCLLDTKRADVEALPDKGIALSLFNGAIRTSENEEMAHLLRRKSEILIAFGSCAYEGCIPGLSNLHDPEATFRTVYLDCPSVDNPENVVPQTEVQVPEGTLELPAFYPRVKTLAEVVEVDYSIPGCPPEPHQIWNVVQLLLSGQPLPPRGSVIGAGNSTVCNECRKVKGDKRISQLKRPYELVPDSERCLLEQGLVCMGVATRDGCGALCPEVDMPCTGCYGPAEGAVDQGARMIGALGSALESGIGPRMRDEEIEGKVDALLESIPDLAGTFYKYSLPASMLKGKRP